MFLNLWHAVDSNVDIFVSCNSIFLKTLIVFHATKQGHGCFGMGQGSAHERPTVDFTRTSCSQTAPSVVHVLRPNEVENKRKDLPIIMMEQEIMEAINFNSAVIVCGETGCGKTTQVPQVGLHGCLVHVIIFFVVYVKRLRWCWAVCK